MAIPYTFAAGEVAHAQAVNDNFSYVLNLIGGLSDGSSLKPPGPIIVGPRRNTQISSEHDTTGTLDPLDENRAFLHLGWNAEFYDTGVVDSLSRPIYKYRRYNAGERATALQLGEDGFTVRTTVKTTGDLNSQLDKVFELYPINGGTRGYLPLSTQFQKRDGPVQSINDYRMLLTLMNSRPAIYQNQPLNPGRSLHNATDYGVPTQARALVIYCKITTEPTTDEANVKFYQAANNPDEGFGFAVWTHQTVHDREKTDSLQGVVPLGEGAYDGRFYIERNGNFQKVTAYIIGYYS